MRINTQHWFFLASLLVVGWLIYLLAAVITPFAISALLAYLADPIVDRLEKLKFSRSMAVIIVFLTLLFLIAGLIFLVVPILESQIVNLVENIPTYLHWLNAELFPWIETQFNVSLRIDADALVQLLKKNWQEAGGVAAKFLQITTSSGIGLFNIIMNLALIPVVAFYLLRDWDVLVEKINHLLPRTIEPAISLIARESDQVLGAFLRGQLTVMIVLGTIYALGLWSIGLELAFVIGILAGLVSFIPYLGVIVGLGAGLVAAIFQYGNILDVHVILVAVVFMAGQLLEGFVLTPWLVGDKVGLHPVAVIFAILAGGQLFGFLGVLLALPAAAVLMVILRHIHDLYKTSNLYEQQRQSTILKSTSD